MPLPPEKIPVHFTVGQRKLIFKTVLKNNVLQYRCSNRYCPAILKFSKEEFETHISTSTTSLNIIEQKHDHTCPEIIENSETVISSDEKAGKLCSPNLTKTRSFHKSFLEQNGISWSSNKVKNFIHILRNKNYPSDEKFLNNPFDIKINLSNEFLYSNNFIDNPTVPSSPFCLNYIKFFDCTKNREERIITFTSLFQLKILAESKEIFIDGTFRSAPQNFYQLLIIHAYQSSTQTYVPCIFALLSSKSLSIYFTTFQLIIGAIYMQKIEINWRYIHSDFEINIFKSVSLLLPNLTFLGCWFHFLKSVYQKAKKLGLFKKEVKTIIKPVLKIIKYIPFTSEETKKSFWSKFKVKLISDLRGPLSQLHYLRTFVFFSIILRITG